MNQIKFKSVIFLLLVAILPCPAWSFDRKTPVVAAIKKVSPAVVNISSEYDALRQNHPFGQNPFFYNVILLQRQGHLYYLTLEMD